MDYIDNTLCITRDRLLASNIITSSTLNHLVERDQVTIVVRGCRGRQAQYAVDSLPKKYREECYKRYDLPPMPREKSLLEQLIRPYPEAVRFYHAYRLPDGRCLPQERISQYTAEAQILEAIGAYWMEHTSKRGKASRRPMGKSEFYGWMVDQLGTISTSDYPHKLPQSVDNLKRKHARYKLEGLESLVHKGYNNRNASKVETTEQEAYLLMLLGNKNNLNNKQVAKLYNEVAEQRGWSTLTASAVGKIARANHLLLDAGRRGRTEYRLRVETAIKRSKPTRSMSYWVHDGWTVELHYQKASEDKRGGRKTVYDCRLVVVVILDASCSYPIGYAIGDRECPALISQALRSATHHTEELFGVKCHPREIQYDHYQEGVLTPLYKAMSNKLSPPKAKNARAKLIEPYFAHLNEDYCKLLPNWSGYGITSTKGKGTNTDAINELKHRIPTREEVEGQIHTIIAQERMKKQAEYLELFDGDVTDIQLDLALYLEHWGETTGRLIGQSIYGLTPTILGEVRYYESFEVSWKAQSHQKWLVYYDPSDLSSVLAVSEDRQYKYLLERKHIQPMAEEDQTEADIEHLRRVHDHHRELEDWVDDRYRAMTPIALEVAEGSKVAKSLLKQSTIPFRKGKGTTKRAIEDTTPAEEEAFGREVVSLIADSKGQCKDNRYDRKLEREGLSSTSEEAPQRRRSILERV